MLFFILTHGTDPKRWHRYRHFHDPAGVLSHRDGQYRRVLYRAQDRHHRQGDPVQEPGVFYTPQDADSDRCGRRAGDRGAGVPQRGLQPGGYADRCRHHHRRIRPQGELRSGAAGAFRLCRGIRGLHRGSGSGIHHRGEGQRRLAVLHRQRLHRREPGHRRRHFQHRVLQCRRYARQDLPRRGWPADPSGNGSKNEPKRTVPNSAICQLRGSGSRKTGGRKGGSWPEHFPQRSSQHLRRVRRLFGRCHRHRAGQSAAGEDPHPGQRRVPAGETVPQDLLLRRRGGLHLSPERGRRSPLRRHRSDPGPGHPGKPVF